MFVKLFDSLRSLEFIKVGIPYRAADGLGCNIMLSIILYLPFSAPLCLGNSGIDRPVFLSA